jgi:hypothetical protein
MSKAIILDYVSIKAISEYRKFQLRVKLGDPEPVMMTDVIPLPIELGRFAKKLKDLSKLGYKQLSTEGLLKGMMHQAFPYGNKDGLIYVKESYAIVDTPEGAKWVYQADDDYDGHFKPAATMPAAGMRMRLKIDNLHIERLQDITEWDVNQEGFRTTETVTAREQFIKHWMKRHGKASWWDNPLVWVVNFREYFN